MIDTKNYILDKYYNEHEKPSIIAKEISVNPSYITKIIKNDKDEWFDYTEIDDKELPS